MPENIDKLQIEVESSAEKAAEGIDKLVTSINNLNGIQNTKALSSIARSIKTFSTAISTLNTEPLKKASKDLQAFENARNDFSKIDEQLKEISSSIKQLSASSSGIQSTSNAIGGIANKAQQATKATAEQKAAMREVQEQAKQLVRETQNAHQGVQSVASGLSSFSGILGGAFSGATSRLNALANTLNRIDKATAGSKIAQDFKLVTEVLSSTKGELDSVQQKILKLNETGGDENAFKQLTTQAGELEGKIGSLTQQQNVLKQALQQLGITGQAGLSQLGTGAQGARIGVDGLKSSVNALNIALSVFTIGITAVTAVLSTLASVFNGIVSIAKKVLTVFKNIASAIGSAVKSISGFVSNIADAARETLGLEKSSKGLEGTLKKLQKVWTKLWNVLQIKIIRTLLNSLFSGVSEGIQNLALQFSSFNAVMSSGVSSVKKFQNSIVAALAPAIAGLMPLVVTLLNAFSRLLEVVGAFFSLVFGTQFYTAKDVAIDYAESLDKIGGAAQKAAKELNLLPFDELNTIAKDLSGTGGSAGGGVQDWFQESPIPQWIQDLFDKDPYELGKDLATWIVEGLSSIDWNWIQSEAKTLANNLASFLNGAIDGVLESDFPGIVGNTIAQALNTALIFAEEFLDTFNFKNFGTFIGTNIQEAIATFEWDRLGRIIGKGVTGAIDTALYAIREINFYELGQNIGDIFVNAVETINWENLGDLILEGFAAALNFFAGLLDRLRTINIGDKIGELFTRFVTDTDWKMVAETIGGYFVWAIEQISSFLEKVNVEDIISAIRSFIEGWPAEEIANSLARFWEAAWEIIIPIVQELIGIDLTPVKEGIEGIDWARIAEVAGGFKDAIIEIGQQLVNLIGKIDIILDKILGFFDPMYKVRQAFKEGVGEASQYYKNAVDEASKDTGIATEEIEKYFRDSESVSEDVANGIREYFGDSLDSVIDASEIAFKAIDHEAKQAEIGVKYSFENVVDASKRASGLIDGDTRELYGGIRAESSETSSQIVQDIDNAAGDIGNTTSALSGSVIRNLYDPLKSGSQQTTDALGKNFTNTSGDIENTLIDLENTIEDDVFAQIDENGLELTNRLFDYVEDLADDTENVLDLIAPMVINDVLNPISTALDEQYTHINTLFDGIKTAYKSVANTIIGYTQSMLSGIGTAIDYVAKALSSLSVSFPDWVPDVGGKSFDISISTPTVPNIPRLKTGMDFVPNDYFPAFLDYGEAVLTRQENANYRRVGGATAVDNMLSGNAYGVAGGINEQQLTNVLTQVLRNNADIFFTEVNLGDTQLYDSVERGKRQRGFITSSAVANEF